MGFRLFTVVILLTVAASAAPILTVTALPASSGTYPAGTSFFPTEVSATANAIGPFSGQSVQFKGWDEINGSSEGLNANQPCPGNGDNPCLVYRYELDFNQPVTILSVTVTGDAFWGENGDQPGQNQIRLLDASMNILGTVQTSGGNVGHTVSFTINPSNATGTRFFLDEFDDSSVWRYRSNISVITADAISAIPEPTSGWLVAAAGITLVRLRRARVALRLNPKK